MNANQSNPGGAAMSGNGVDMRKYPPLYVYGRSVRMRAAALANGCSVPWLR